MTDVEISGKVAIVGIVPRVAGAKDVHEFWRLLRDGVDAGQVLSEDKLPRLCVQSETAASSGFVPHPYQLDDVDLFDAEFFRISSREADILDPQQRIMMECCWQALETAGFASTEPDVRVGVFAGSSGSTYARQLMAAPEIVEAFGDRMIRYANESDYLPARVAYTFGLRGPALNVQTACSTALVATHIGTQSLLANECDIALVGGVSVLLPQDVGYTSSPGGRSARQHRKAGRLSRHRSSLGSADLGRSTLLVFSAATREVREPQWLRSAAVVRSCMGRFWPETG